MAIGVWAAVWSSRARGEGVVGWGVVLRGGAKGAGHVRVVVTTVLSAINASLTRRPGRGGND